MHRAIRDEEFERGRSLIRAARPRFPRVRTCDSSGGIASSKREIYDAPGIMNSRSRSTAPRRSAARFFPLIETKEGRRRRSRSGERKLIADATGTKLPNRLFLSRTGTLISRANASTRRTLFFRGRGPSVIMAIAARFGNW